MKHWLTLLLFAGIAVTANAADWSRVESPLGGVALYVDKVTAEKSGPGQVLLWHVADYEQAQDREGKAFRSIKFRNEYDCEKSMVRDMLRSWHKEPMGEGLVVYWNHGPWPWTRPESGSMDEVLLRAACAGK